MNEIALRLLWGGVLSGSLAALAWGLGLVTAGGAAAGLAVGLAVYLGTGPAGFACLAAFFVVGSALTHVGYQRKADRGVAEPRGGARGAWEVLGKGGVAALLALGSLWHGGAVYFQLGFVGALASALGDTASTELGQLRSGGAWLLLPWKRAQVGTPGAVSALGTAAGALGSLAVALLAWGLGLLELSAAGAAAGGGLAGNLFESVVQSASGKRVGHYTLNLMTTAAGALVAIALWSLLR